MQGWRQPQPSGTNRPSSYPSHPRGRSCMCLAGATQVGQGTRSVELAVRPPGHAEGTLKRGRHSHRLETSAAHRSAAMAGGARPDPFRTRKLSRRAPMVLRGQPVGEQGAADPHPAGSTRIRRARARGRRGGIPPAAPPSFSSRMRPQGPAGFRSRRLVAQFSPYRSAEGPPGPFFHAAGTFAGRRPCVAS